MERGIGNSCLKSDGSLGDILVLPSFGESRTMKMNGNEVFKHAVRMMSDVSGIVLEASGMTPDTIDYFIPHQANSRIITAVAKKLSIPPDKVVMNVDKYGNTSSASIPIALEGIWSEGKVTEGTSVLFTALGGGVTAGSVFVRF
jgi:3-oxoacyl-[acyl-carrier-protein] synthase III